MSRSIISQFIKEYNAPVVITVTTPEVEDICLKNGLLFHEMLSAFGHVDVSASIRLGSQHIPIHDAHIRFERSTESKAKDAATVERRLRDVFEEHDISRAPGSVSELKAAPPSCWTSKTEKIITHMLSFSEYEMASHPHLILTVVATSDIDHAATMQELVSATHTPSNLISTGQYDPSIVQRVYILLHDHNDTVNNPHSILQQLQLKFNSAYTRLLTINSFPAEYPNISQPDVWSQFVVPLYYPEQLPPTAIKANLPAIIGCRLSAEDFISMRNFIVDIYTQWIVPSMERRILIMNKVVNDARKGMRNVLKSFWRKPREESEQVKGGIKYRFDKIESQILFLADTSFSVRDYETAMSMYKLVRDDFKADKSTLHVAYTSLMIAMCKLMLDPKNLKEVYTEVELLAQILLNNQEEPYLNACFAILSSELYMINHNRAPLDAAKILLQVAETMGGGVGYSVLSAILIERAAGYLMLAQQYRKYIFYSILASNLFLKCGNRPAKHAATCFACIMLIIDRTRWGDLKGKLYCMLAEDARHSTDVRTSQRSLLFMLKMIATAFCESTDIGVTNAFLTQKALSYFHELLGNDSVNRNSRWGRIHIGSDWSKLNTQQILFNTPLPITMYDDVRDDDDDDGTPSGDVSSDTSVVRPFIAINNLSIPELDLSSVMFLNSFRGIETHRMMNAPISGSEISQAEEMYVYLTLENQWVDDKQNRSNTSMTGEAAATAVMSVVQMTTSNSSTGSGGGGGGGGGGVSNEHLVTPPLISSNSSDDTSLADVWAEKEAELIRIRDSNRSSSYLPSGGGEDKTLRIPLGEEVKLSVYFTNSRCEDLKLSRIKLIPDHEELFQTPEVTVTLPHSNRVGLILTSKPLQCGQHKINSVSWDLSDSFQVIQSLQKPGPLLQASRQQRAMRERALDTSLLFTVIPTHPLLRITFEGLSPEVLQGQLLKSTLLLTNDGAAAACDIVIKLNQPSFVFYIAQVISDNISNNSSSSSFTNTINYSDNTTADIPGSSSSTTTNRRSSFSDGLVTCSGGSSTVMRLSPTITILPGQSLRLEAWMMLNRCGLQKVSLLAAYKALREDGTKDCFGPGNRCRTSFVSIKTTVLPSLSIEHHLIPTASSAQRYTIVSEIKNSMGECSSSSFSSPADGGGGGDGERLSSVGQLDLSSIIVQEGDHSSLVDDNSFEILGTWLVGAGAAHQYRTKGSSSCSSIDGSRNSRGHIKQSSPTVIIGPSDRLTKCYPIKLDTSVSSAEVVVASSGTHPHPIRGDCSWLSAMSQSNGADTHLIRIVEQFLCMQYASECFRAEIENSRILVKAAELEAETIGPRTIAQVRRDKLSNKSNSNGSNDAATIMLETTAANTTRKIFAVPTNASELSSLLAAALSTSVTTIWICRWEGKLRWGVHHDSSLSFIAKPTAISSTALSKPSSSLPAPLTESAADFLIVCLSHPHIAKLPTPVDNSSSLTIPVVITFRSLSTRPLSITITAIDHLNYSTSTTIGTSSNALSSPSTTKASSHKLSPMPSSNSISDSSGDYISMVDNIGFKWNDKVQHNGLQLLPFSQHQLTMHALITRAGLYDFNKFKISVRFSDSSSTQSSTKKIVGQSLVLVESK